ncbi:MAG TPA: hypothetical protein VK841_20315 [Polyangiaceae bacterium]|jgi:hypothetical protein|nr:hypothetical protein [Polyangiaceae bacterium]
MSGFRPVRTLGPAAAMATAVALSLAASQATADAPQPSPPAPPPCDAWEIDYTLAGNLKLTDTTLGQGDGVYPVGPGAAVLRFEDHGGQPGGRAKLVNYSMKQGVTVTASALFFTAKVVSETVTRALPDACGVDGEGTLNGTTLAWAGPIRAFKSDGTITCEGSLCGKFGAPPLGQSPLHIGPNPVQLQPFQFSGDLKTFSMPSTFVSKTEDPKQTAYLALSGREMKRSCVQVRPCP